MLLKPCKQESIGFRQQRLFKIAKVENAMKRKRHSSFIYIERKIQDMSNKFFVPGAGRISGYISLILGAMTILGVLCFKYPTYLTTAELRALYNLDLLRALLRVCMWTAFLLGLSNVMRNKRRWMGLLGILFVSVSIALGGYNVQLGEVENVPLAVGLDWLLLDLFFSAILFIFIEKIVPKYTEQAILRPEWKLDLLYFGVNHVMIGVLLLISNRFVPNMMSWAVNDGIQSFMRSLHVGWQVLILLLCADFVQYWVHRTFHVIKPLWKVHAVHHCVEHMDWLAGSRNHIFQTVVDRAMMTIPLYLLGPDTAALNIYVMVAAFQAVFIHANVGINFGFLNYIIATPQFHHWHHSSEKPAIDTNYGIHFPIFDLLFGTFHMPKDKWPAQYGTLDELPKDFMGQIAYPLKSSKE